MIKLKTNQSLLILFLLFGFLTSVPATTDAVEVWDKQIVQDGWCVGQYTSMAIIQTEDLEYPVISYYDYGNNDLEYTWLDDTEWKTMTVDKDGDVGMYSSLQILPSAHPAISYYDNTNGNLKYAWYDGEQWHTVTVDDSQEIEGYTSLAIIDGQPAISYYGNNVLKYAWHDGYQWQNTIVDDNGDVGKYASLVNKSGKPAISYFDETNDDLKYKELTGSDPANPDHWLSSIIDDANDVGRYCSLVILPGDMPAVSYYDNTEDNLKYAWHDGVGWQNTIVDSEDNVGEYTSMAALPSGQPIISYFKRTYSHLRFAWFDGDEWQINVVEQAYGSRGEYTDIAVFPSTGMPAISYFNRFKNCLKYAWFQGFGWYNTVVDKGKWEGEYASLAIESSSGQPAVSYVDMANDCLKYTWYDGDSWLEDTIDDENEIDQYTSLVFLPSGNPAISYYTWTGRNLMYAQYDGNEWQKTILVDAPETGRYSSLAINPSLSEPAVAYESNGDLEYGWYDGNEWHIGIIVDGEGDVGYYCSLQFLPSGKPSISYRNVTNSSLQYAELVGDDPSNPADWRLDIIDGNGIGSDVGEYSSLSILPTGHPAISYYDKGNKDLKYAWYDGVNWQSETVDDEADSGKHTGLAIINGHPSICYRSDGMLKYAWYDGYQWTKNIIDTKGAAFTTLKVIDGKPVIGYYNDNTIDIKYVRLVDSIELGDFNSSGNVDMSDMTIFSAAWLSNTEDINWDQRCDLYIDGIIDLRDFAVVSRNWLITF